MRKRVRLNNFLRAGIAASVLVASSHGQGQSNAKTPDQRAILEQILTQTYLPSEVGKHLMGVGSDTDIRKPGIIVVMQRDGLYGSLLRSEIASSAIHGVEAKLYRGHRDYAVPSGERFYVGTVHVGISTVDIGLLSARPVNTSKGAGRVWTAATFYFEEDVLANAEKDVVIREIDQWFVPEGRGAAMAPTAATSMAAPVASAPAAVSAVPAVAPATVTDELAAGMTREQVVAAIGKPSREVNFQTQTWMHYPGMVVTLRDGKLASVEDTGGSAAVTMRSEPAGAEIYLDGQLTGATTSTLQISAGKHQISVKLAGYQDWSRDVKVLAGSELQFMAKLAKTKE